MLTEEQRKNIVKWIKLLESGRFKQGRSGYLRKENKYCCLGVACEYVLRITPVYSHSHNCFTYHGSVGLLPASAQESLGLVSALGSIHVNDIPISVSRRWKDGWEDRLKTLAGMNDGGVSFKTIAKILRHKFNIRDKI